MTEKLIPYKQKRNFEKTLEPEGIENVPAGELTFVVQHHRARIDHYDFRLEWEGVLLSWAVPKGPSFNTRDKRLAVHVEDHPLEYRNFEGVIPKGEYGGGTVMIWDEGYWEPSGDVKEGLKKGVLKFKLKGRRLKGKWTLVRLKEKEGNMKDNWLLVKEKDEYVRPDDGISQFNTSIRTGRTMREIEEGKEEKITKNPFDRVDVQLAKLVKTIPEGDDWLFELKYDGYRIISFIEGNDVRLITRNGNDFTKRFQDIAYSLGELAAGRAMVLDGEMTIIDSVGKTDFQALQNYMKNPKGKNLTYIIFDLLALDGLDFRSKPLIKRKEKLEALLKDAPKNLYYSRHVTGKGEECFLAACKLEMEGIVGKKADSPYTGTRNGDWIKIKCEKRQEFVIGGYTISDKKTRGISSLLLGVYEGEDLVYAGRAGTGFCGRDIAALTEKFESIIRPDCPFKTAPKAKPEEEITWLCPELVAEIKFAEWTRENLLRQASFKGLRLDKDPKEVRRELTKEDVFCQQNEENIVPAESNYNAITIQGIKITNPDKLMFAEPEIRKIDVLRYYEKVAERMLPYVSHRILSMVRCPKGITQTCFFKKHPDPGSKGILTFSVINGEGEREEYFYIENITGIIWEAQMGSLEFHIWGSRIEEVEKPDMMVFDLDPDEGMDLEQVRQGVLDLKSILNELSLISYLKISGGKGYHVVVPLKPAGSWDVVRNFSKSVAEVMEQKWPDRYTSNIRKSKRSNKIFIDWIRNVKGATSVAPYSIRARKGAKISMPISWEELNHVAPDSFDIKNALDRIKGSDPWKDFYNNNQWIK
jgi:bifunctional non-homologous end joining protein LigD